MGALLVAMFRSGLCGLVCLASHRREKLPFDTLDADGDAQATNGDQDTMVVAKQEMEANMIKREVKKKVDGSPVAEKDWEQKETREATGVVARTEKKSHEHRAETHIIVMHLVKRVTPPVAEEMKQKESGEATGVVAKRGKERHTRKAETLLIVLHLGKREKTKEVDEEPRQGSG